MLVCRSFQNRTILSSAMILFVKIKLKSIIFLCNYGIVLLKVAYVCQYVFVLIRGRQMVL